MASIAKLAVILSAVTKPLEDGLKGAQSKLSSFGKGMSHGAGIGLGVLGLDKIEGAMKKALKASPELGDAAEKVELAFGRALVSLTGMSQWLPQLAKDADGFASRVEEGFVMQEVKEGLLWIWEASKNGNAAAADARAKESRDYFNIMKIREKGLERIAELEFKRKMAAHETHRIQTMGTEQMGAMVESLHSKRVGLDPDYEKNMIQAMRKDAPNSINMMLIDYELKEIAVLEARKKAEEEKNKMIEEGKSLTEANFTPMEKLASEQEKYNKLLAAGAIDMNTYNRAIKALTPGLKEVEDIQKEIFKLENGELAAKLKDMKEGGASDAVLKQYEKEYNRLEKMKKDQEELAKEDEMEGKDFADKPEQKFAGAIEAGSAEAYSAAIRAQAGMRDDGMLAVNRSQLQVSKEQWEIQKQILKAQGDATKAFEASKGFARLTLGGGN